MVFLNDEIFKRFFEIQRFDFRFHNFFSKSMTSHLSLTKFEEKIWKQLQLLHNVDPHPWDSEVSSDPENSKFSFSIAGKAFCIIGMHPKSSRMARQSPYPAMIFNLHWQFEKLRDMGVYQRVKKRIRKADEKLQGSINPMLDDFGDSSEARQYSGRAVDSNWKCPFHH
ncbi:MAG: YqcI/YcgG family protein [Bacteroidetes bacterium]|nr:YqcI/YcgG family protein [Bacteroidota bacterium]